MGLVEYMMESKGEYTKLQKATAGVLNFESDFDVYSDQIYKHIHKLFISLLEQEDFAQDRLINNLKEKVCTICTNNLLEILRTVA